MLGGSNPVGGTFGGSSSFQTIGDRIYGLNQGVDTGNQNVETTMFQSDTGSYYTVAKFRFSINSSSSDDIQMKIYFNNIVIFAEYATSGTVESDMFPIDLIIPPFTQVKMTAENKASSTGREIFTVITGRMY
jgi:hypothetical protein